MIQICYENQFPIFKSTKIQKKQSLNQKKGSSLLEFSFQCYAQEKWNNQLTITLKRLPLPYKTILAVHSIPIRAVHNIKRPSRQRSKQQKKYLLMTLTKSKTHLSGHYSSFSVQFYRAKVRSHNEPRLAVKRPAKIFEKKKRQRAKINTGMTPGHSGGHRHCPQVTGRFAK